MKRIIKHVCLVGLSHVCVNTMHGSQNVKSVLCVWLEIPIHIMIVTPTGMVHIKTALGTMVPQGI